MHLPDTFASSDALASDTQQIRAQLTLQRPEFCLQVDLELPGQGVTVIFGPSGSGKTTLLRCLAGLEQANGTVVINAKTWQDSRKNLWVPTWSRRLGYVFQEASLFEHLSVRDNLLYGIKRTSQRNNPTTLADTIALLGIEHLLERTVDQLSGGERQRIAIARALATEPEVMLLDEPLAALDMSRKRDILPWLERLHRTLRIPMVYVTHSLDELTRLADYVVCLHEGQVEQQGPLAHILTDTRFTQRTGAEAGSVLEGVVIQHDVSFHLTQIRMGDSTLWMPSPEEPCAPGTRLRLHVHANDVLLMTCAPNDSTLCSGFHARIERISKDTHPAYHLVHLVNSDQRLLARVTRKWLTSQSIKEHMTVWVHVNAGMGTR